MSCLPLPFLPLQGHFIHFARFFPHVVINRNSIVCLKMRSAHRRCSCILSTNKAAVTAVAPTRFLRATTIEGQYDQKFFARLTFH